MRVHDVNVVADPNRRIPAAPEPVEADGTIFSQQSPPLQDEWPSKVISWWTGPWPQLHCRIEESNPEGATIVTQVKTDLLGHIAIETLNVVDEENNELENLDESAAQLALQLILDYWIVALGLVAIEFMWASVCFAATAMPAWLPFAALLGIDWLILYTYSLSIFEATLRNSGHPPSVRFWVLVAAGCVLGFGGLLVEFGVPVLGSILAAKDVTDALLARLPGGFVLVFFKLLALVSLAFYAFNTLQYG